MFIKANNRIYQLKFGLNALMALDDFVNIDEQEKIVIKFYLALGDSSLTLSDAEDIMAELNCDIEALLDEVLKESLGVEKIDDSHSLSIKEQVEELYQLAVGQLGISPQVFFDMTPHEIELCYRGYLSGKELDTTLSVIAARKSKDPEVTSIDIMGDGYKLSSIAKRKETFSSLGI